MLILQHNKFLVPVYTLWLSAVQSIRHENIFIMGIPDLTASKMQKGGKIAYLSDVMTGNQTQALATESKSRL